MAVWINRILQRMSCNFNSGIKARYQSTAVNPSEESVPFATYKLMTEATKEDFDNQMLHFNRDTSPQNRADGLLAMLRSQLGVMGGHSVDLYSHNVQCGSRAFRDGADAETVVCALFHDIGEIITPACHGEIAASILRPYISAQNYWVLQHHEIFQAYYYGHACGVDPDIRDMFASHEYFSACEQFCRDWDQTAFDPGYENLPLSKFEPLVLEVLSRNAYGACKQQPDINVAKKRLLPYYKN